MKKILLSLVMLAGLATFAHADEPLFSVKRFAFAAGVNHEWSEYGGAVALPQDGAFTVGIYGAYALTAPSDGTFTPRLSVPASLVRDLENENWRWSVGLRVTLWDGGR